MTKGIAHESSEDYFFEGPVDPQGTDSIRSSRRTWGLYTLIQATAWNHMETLNMNGLYGYHRPSGDQTTLVLTHADRGIKVCGHNQLVGNVFLPTASVERAYIENQSFVGKTMVEGNVFELGHGSSISSCSASEYLRTIEAIGTKEGLTIEDIPLEMIRSFSDEPVWFFGRDSLALVGHTLTGQIGIWSDGPVSLIDCSVDQIWVIAPKIYVSTSQPSSGHFWATEELVIREGTVLEYPSSALLCRKMRDEDVQIRVEGSVEFEGPVVLLDEDPGKGRGIIDLQSGSKVTGQVIAQGKVSLNGEVHGVVRARNALLKTPSSVYVNHLLNSITDVTLLPGSYCGVQETLDENELVLVKEL
ncbi:MAG: hypothetical protein KDC12_09540 [Flavobacteriales bacterium]|nr:hypothetical protein [Flavobacteriales bacterium]